MIKFYVDIEDIVSTESSLQVGLNFIIEINPVSSGTPIDFSQFSNNFLGMSSLQQILEFLDTFEGTSQPSVGIFDATFDNTFN